jgi:hypothetical protein
MGPRGIVLLVGALIWGTFIALFLMTGAQLFLFTGILAIMGQVGASVAVSRR